MSGATMRERFYDVARAALDEEPRLAVVTAEIGTTPLGPHPRHFNVGIREQLMIGVAAGLALEGYRAVAHSYAPFLVERPYEQVKLDLGHQGLGAVLVSTGASYDAASEGRTHQAPEDVAALAALPGWTIHVPGHADEVERLFRQAIAQRRPRLHPALRGGEPGAGGRRRPRRAPARRRRARRSSSRSARRSARCSQATVDLDVTVAYLATVRPFPGAALREALGAGTAVVLVEPYLAGTSSAEVSAALADRPHRLLALGVGNAELRRYGTGAEHRAAHGLDAAGIRASLDAFLDAASSTK